MRRNPGIFLLRSTAAQTKGVKASLPSLRQPSLSTAERRADESKLAELKRKVGRQALAASSGASQFLIGPRSNGYLMHAARSMKSARCVKPLQKPLQNGEVRIREPKHR